ncbi:hypothetical protein [Streptomyces sp. NPDC055506]
MSIPTLLRHVGINAPRSVTVDGRIVLDGAHTVSQPITKMEPHRFHGGEDPSPVRSEFQSAWWNTDPAGRQSDVEAMRAAFPAFTLVDDEGDYFYFGEINTGRGVFPVAVFPQVNKSLPSVRTTRRLGRQEGKRWKKPPHLYTSDALCIAGASDWNPERHSTATAVAWAAHWFAAYTEWRMRGFWPTDGYGEVA